MFTPLQLSEISFARTRFGGYDMASVDAVLTPLTEDYTAIYNENERLKSKMRSLVKKCEEYRTAAENQRASTGDAKKVCDRMIRDAEAKCAEILAQANAEASAIMEKASADIALEKKKAMNDAKDEISDIAMAIAGKVVGRELSVADQSDLVDAFIDGLGDGV